MEERLVSIPVNVLKGFAERIAVAGTPFENIYAFLDEAVRYGEAHRKQFL